MANIFVCQFFAHKQMSQVPSALSASDFRPSAVRVQCLPDSTLYLIIKTRPAATGFKLIFGIIKWRFASPADIDAFLFVVQIFTNKRLLCLLVEYHSFFFWS